MKHIFASALFAFSSAAVCVVAATAPIPSFFNACPPAGSFGDNSTITVAGQSSVGMRECNVSGSVTVMPDASAGVSDDFGIYFVENVFWPNSSLVIQPLPSMLFPINVVVADNIFNGSVAIRVGGFFPAGSSVLFSGNTHVIENQLISRPIFDFSGFRGQAGSSIIIEEGAFTITSEPLATVDDEEDSVVPSQSDPLVIVNLADVVLASDGDRRVFCQRR